MKPERWRQIISLAEAAAERGKQERAAFLDGVCAGDEDLRKEVESLLASDEQAESFIEAPALGIAPGLLHDRRATKSSIRRLLPLGRQSTAAYTAIRPARTPR